MIAGHIENILLRLRKNTQCEGIWYEDLLRKSRYTGTPDLKEAKQIMTQSQAGIRAIRVPIAPTVDFQPELTLVFH